MLALKSSFSNLKECKRSDCLALWKRPFILCNTVKHVLSGHSNIDKTKALKTNRSFMKVQRIAKRSLGAFGNTLDLH